MRAQPLTVGEPAPWFRARTPLNDEYDFDTVAGRYVVISFVGSAKDPEAARLLLDIRAGRARFNDIDACFFAVSVDPADESERRISDSIPGLRVFWDFDRAVSGLYGALLPDGGYRPITYVLDPALRVVAALALSKGSAHCASLFALLDRLPRAAPAHAATAQAPVLVLPRVFEPALCEALIGYYGRKGGKDSGFMRDLNGKTTEIVEHVHKRRRDCTIEDESLRHSCMVRIHDRLGPEIEKAFQFRPTRMERYIVSCYDAAEQAHFLAHRDNTTKGTAHRRFAVSLFLNTGQYEGGFLRFPEFGSALYSAPAGGAVVFSCSLMHEATEVTKGRRFMFLPFLYDDAARQIREQNFRFVDGMQEREEARAVVAGAQDEAS